MTYLAVERHVAKSTQSQAFNALLFFYRNVLGSDPGDIRNTIRARPKRRLPVVLTRTEMSSLLAQLSGIPQLMAQTIYGGGLRLQECISHADQGYRFRAEYYHLRRALVELAVDSRKTLQRYSELCAAADNEEDAVRSASLKGFAF